MSMVSTRLSSKGQIVIPASIREELDLAPGDELTVEMSGDGGILLRRPDAAEMMRRVTEGYAWFEKNGVDLVEQLHESRRRERAREVRRREKPQAARRRT